MNREIKFRVWNYKENKYHMPFKNCSTTYNLNYFENTKHVCYPQQFSGLVINENDIYEGDYDEDEETIAIVVFKNGSFGLDLYYKCDNGKIRFELFEQFGMFELSDYSFDKNIHDNPIEVIK